MPGRIRRAPAGTANGRSIPNADQLLDSPAGSVRCAAVLTEIVMPKQPDPIDEIEKLLDEIEKLLEQAQVLAQLLIERRARKVLQEHAHLDEFLMGMGAAFFTVKGKPHVSLVVGRPPEFNYLVPVWEVIDRLNAQLSITGSPMRFTAYGDVVTDW